DHAAGLLDVLLASPDVGGDDSGVRVLIVIGADRVGQAALLAHLDEQPRGRGAAEDRVEHLLRVAPIVVAPDPGTAETDVVLLGVLLVEQQPGLDRVRDAVAVRRALLRGHDEAARQLADLLVLDVARGGDHQIGPYVVAVVVCVDLGYRYRRDHLRAA